MAWCSIVNDNSTLRHVLADHLSSTHAEIGENQSGLGQGRYTPFGSERSVSGTIADRERFTGQKRIDAPVGSPRKELYYYGARWYLPGVGIFTQPDTIVPDYKNPQALNRYSYVYNNPVKYVDPTGHAASDLQYYPGATGWYDKAWHDLFVKTHHREPWAEDYVYRFVTMGLREGWTGEQLMQPVVTAIGAGSEPSGPGLWAQPSDQTGVQEARDEWRRAHARGYPAYGQAPDPEFSDRLNLGTNFKEYRWGKIRIISNAGGHAGWLARLLGGEGNAITFSPNLIVFTGLLDLSKPGDMWHLLHELKHVRQAQGLGVAYLPMYTVMSPLTHAYNPFEFDANAFANGANIPGAPDRWD
ncbi:MAG: RHS repeat-associated core domain-containing protein [Chloroflexi bacterium]|nr:RHS repeat-associated core domain-containing protein [Chloroflexota bacterium]